MTIPLIGNHLQEYHYVLQSFGGNLVRVDFSDLGHSHCVGEDPDFILAERGHLLEFGEGGCLVDIVEVHPHIGVPLDVISVVDQDLILFHGDGKKDFQVLRQFVDVFLEILSNDLDFFTSE